MQNKMGGVCGTHGRDYKCVQGFGWKTLREEYLGVSEIILLKWITKK
jgi:hypothetical protein